MYRSILHHCALLLSISCVYGDTKYDEAAVTRFVSRPDIVAPKWEVTVYDRSRVAPGYWFVAPFEDVGQNKAGEEWIGPYIFDGEGELVWSGTKLFGYWNVFDFRISNVLGEKHLTLFTGQDGMATVLGDDYRIRDQWRMGWVNVDVNLHELNFVNDGTRALIGKEHHQKANLENSKTVAWEAGDCKVINQGFQEMDVRTWQPLFEWNSGDHVWLNESTFVDEPVEARCGGDWDWDYFHINSIDKSKDGDYFVSARHTDTLYKVSGQDGSIIWRLGGKMSSFEMGDLHFTRQHDVRYRGENETHTFLSFLDNAKGQDRSQPSARMSRGIFVALQTDVQPMVAHIQQVIEHPEGLSMYAPRRGNLQKLPYGDNTWVQWSEQALQSEHDKDGQLLMKAKMLTKWMGTYRSYKFPFVGRPSEPIAVHAQAYAAADDGSGARTLVHASWNGATEVAAWSLYKTTHTGAPRVFVATLPRQGFETPLAFDGFASYVVVEALDRDGKVLGTSDIYKSIPPSAPNDAVAAEVLWLQTVAAADATSQQAMDEEAAEKSGAKPATASVGAFGATPVGLFVIGFVVSVGAVVAVWRFHAPRRILNIAMPFLRGSGEKGNAVYQALMTSSRDVEHGTSSDSHVYNDK